jgi:uncharacterized protein (TIGR02284 family)
MAEDDVIEILEDLIKTCRDGENGYRQAAEKVKSSELATFFRERSSERAQFAQELESEAARLGKTKLKGEGSVAGAVHRAWIDLKEKVGGGDKTILESVEKGEDSAKQAYQDALREEGLRPELRTMIQRQAQSVFFAHDRVKSLRDAAKAA